jgi:thiamine biosynthesis lipoprotein
MMGTFVEVTSPHPNASKIALDEIQRIEDILSKYKPESEVSHLNKASEIKASPELFYILSRSKEFWATSDGAFDITVAPLMDLWGFTDKNFRKPSFEEIRRTLNFIGTNKIILNSENNVVKFVVPGMKIDLGAIAKGYAVDCAVKKLKEAKISSCLVNAGGQVHALGTKFGKPWKIAIKDPREKGIKGFLYLKDVAVATSGDYHQFFFEGGRRFSHIMNPATGYPQDSGVISVTVLAGDGLTADALATAIAVLGKEKGAELVKKFPGVRAKIIEHE